MGLQTEEKHRIRCQETFSLAEESEFNDLHTIIYITISLKKYKITLISHSIIGVGNFLLVHLASRFGLY